MMLWLEKNHNRRLWWLCSKWDAAAAADVDDDRTHLQTM